VIDRLDAAPLASAIAAPGVDIGLSEAVIEIAMSPAGDALVIATTRSTYVVPSCVVALPALPDGFDTPPSTRNRRVHIDQAPELDTDDDVLVIGSSDWAVELAAQALHEGAYVVLAAGGLDPAALSEASAIALNDLADHPRFAALFRATAEPDMQSDGYPLVRFTGARTPDLEFDHVIYASTRGTQDTVRLHATDEAIRSGRIHLVTDIGQSQLSGTHPEPVRLPTASSLARRLRIPAALDELRDELYNATITAFDRAHDDLWILRVRPDTGEASFLPGQYASLGLGYWERRIDNAVDPDLDGRWNKLIRRSYSISSRIFDEHGYFADDTRAGELELYVVLVAPTQNHIPGLTPRLALKQPGDRVFLGPKVAGRYNLRHVTDAETTVVFLSTGTGEAPHNAMVVELLQRGHRGPIVSAVTVRKSADLAYHDKHQTLAKVHSNYHYLPLPTREPSIPKRYIQDLITSGDLEEEFRIELDPKTTEVFLCGNPRMIGLPEIANGTVQYPTPPGVVELLVQRGFALDTADGPGNIHFEEYW